MFAASATTEVFRCPGEAYDISRSVHLARFAAFYAKCRSCPHAPDAAPSSTASGPAAAELAPAGQLSGLFTADGVRGRYLNELTRSGAAEIAGAMASCLWDEFADPLLVVPPSGGERLVTPIANNPPEGGTPMTEGIRLLETGHPGPCVVLAHDERPSSPDIVTGVGQSLRRMGCRVVDIGLATRPCFLFAVDHLRAAGGVLVTGAGCDPGWTGLDFLTQGSVPCSSGGQLDRIAARYHQGYSRVSRRPGFQRSFQAAVPYEAGLWKHFHALRPLKITFACPGRTLDDLFGKIFRKVACRLLPVETPTRSRAFGDRTDPDFARTSRAVCENGSDLGVLIEDDGECCTFFDEQGAIVPPQAMARILLTIAAQDHSAGGAIILPRAWQGGFPEAASIFVADPTSENITLAMRAHRAVFAADGRGRYWFAETSPVCDALLTLVHLLQALSRSDTPFSRVV